VPKPLAVGSPGAKLYDHHISRDNEILLRKESR